MTDDWANLVIYDDGRTEPEVTLEFVTGDRAQACGLGAWANKFCGRVIRHNGPHIDVYPRLVSTLGVLNVGGGIFGEFVAMSKPEIVALSGVAQVGKDTGAAILADFGYQRLAFADILRDSVYRLNPIVLYLHSYRPRGITSPNDHQGCYVRVQQLIDDIGWDRAKVEYAEVRELLQRMGTEVGRDLYGVNFWVNKVAEQIKPNGKYVITDARFPNEVEAVHSWGGKVYRIERPGTSAVNNHISDTGVASLPVDGVVVNDGTIESYRENLLNVLGISS